MADHGEVVIQDNQARRRYEVTIDGRRAMLTYTRRPGSIELIHTDVPSELRGRGLASALARRALDDARAAGVRVIATCPFVQAYVRRHLAYQPLIEKAAAGRGGKR